MPVSEQSMLRWCRTLIGADAVPHKSLNDYLQAIPRLKTLADVPRGTAVLVRGDVDAKPGPKIGEGDERLRSMISTLKFGVEQGWKQIVFGHIGRKPEGSLSKVAARLGELLGKKLPLISDWLDEKTMQILPAAANAVSNCQPGEIIVLENTRKYAIERALWDATPDDLPALAPKLATLANEFAQKVSAIYVNEALSAGSLDSSSTIVPAAMNRVALGNYVAGEFDGPMQRCLRASLVIFSGLKIDKLDDLQAMIDRGTIRWVITAGSLAMALKKAAAELEGKTFCMGVAEDPAHAGKPYFIPRQRVEQARRMIEEGRKKGIQFVLPVDFVLQDGRASETIGPADQQFDIGPKTSEFFAQKIGEFIADSTHQAATGGRAAETDSPVAFHNGVFGMFEDPRFEAGTKNFIGQLKRMKDSGVEVYVGGGEGGAALEKYGQPNWVTHCFTAGGTVLNALGSNPVPYLLALSMAAKR
ncbi:MAG TPA: phosphoglycerate kinase [Pirellulales bacterium]|jgi:phosphoglycerate kinase|nr:phosphoglycerate kinase [Pirellulales bacterium]